MIRGQRVSTAPLRARQPELERDPDPRVGPRAPLQSESSYGARDMSSRVSDRRQDIRDSNHRTYCVCNFLNWSFRSGAWKDVPLGIEAETIRWRSWCFLIILSFSCVFMHRMRCSSFDNLTRLETMWNIVRAIYFFN